MEQACVGFCEIDKYAHQSYMAIHEPGEGEYYATDIRGVEPGELPEADCYTGGFPCQSFSVAGKRGGFEDTRGTLFFEIMRLAKARKPKYLFLENVKGLLSHSTPLSYGVIHEIILTDLYDWRTLWEEKKSSPMSNFNLSNAIMNYYIREILELKSEKQNHKSEELSKTIWDIVIGKKEIGQKCGLIGNYKSLPTKIKQFMKNVECCHTEVGMQLELNAKDLAMNLDQLFSIENLKQVDISTLEKTMDMLGDVEKMLKKMLGRPLGDEEIVHHINGNKTDDRPENLFVCSSRTEHSNIHNTGFALFEELIRRGVIYFDRQKGGYELC